MGRCGPGVARLGRVIVYDRRGCTRSQRPDPYDKTSVAEHADDAAALLDALGAAPAAVVGRSYGGGVASTWPCGIRSVAAGWCCWKRRSLACRPTPSSGRHRCAGGCWPPTDVTTIGEIFIRFVLGDATWEGFPVPIKQMFTDNGPPSCRGHRRILRVDQAELGTIDVPTLLIAAAHSPEAFRQVIDAMADAMPNSRKHTVEGGHLINPADPAVRFLQDLPG